jgi:hypothetical protein
MDNSFLVAIAGWIFPGAGHFLQGRWKIGLVLSAVIWTMFAVGILGGGAYYPGFDFKDGALLYLLNIFARLGNLLGAAISFFFLGNPPAQVASWATFEYAGRFLEVAGLLNYLAVLDALDIQIGRKK